MYRYCSIFSLLLLCCFCSTQCAEMSVRGSEYVKFDLLGTNTSIYGASDTLSVRFKTFEQHGLLFYAHGVGYVSLELYHCKLRYTINMGEEFSFFFGDKLCDNDWHRVLMTRDKHKLTIHLDNGPAKTVDIQMSKRFEAHVKLRIHVRIYVGGTWKKTNERKATKLTKNFVGCLADVSFNAYHIISDAQKKTNGYTVEGGVIPFSCPAKDYKPIGFVNEYAYLTIPSPDCNKVLVEFKFRTFDQNGLLMYRDGPKISVWLYLQKGKLKFEFYIPNKKLLTLDTSTWLHGTNFNDGEWHSVKASLDRALMTFRVDNGSETTLDAHAVLLGDQAKKLDFENFTHVGGGTYYKKMYGFVGCMRDLHVNEAKIDVVNLPKDVEAVNIELGKCTFESLCHPSSCQYKSSCEQRSNNFTCHCKRFYSGRYCQVPMFQSTCEGYKELGMKEDAYCRVDADGTGPLHEFKVLCNMTNSKDAVTIVNHTSSARQVKIMDEAYTFSYSARSWAHKLDYGVDFESLRALIDESDHCRQYVEFNCINTKFLTRRELELPGAYWVSENGVEHHYWGGGKLGGVTCACGTTLSCHDKTKTCNCDTGDGVWRQDAGYLTNKDHLPVASLFFPKSAGKSNFSVGPLECFGRKKTLTRETDEQKFFGIACQPLVTQPPPVFPWEQNTLTSTAQSKILSTAPKSFNSTSGKPTKADSNDSSNDNSTDANSTQSDYGNDTLSPTGATTVNGNTSFFPGEPTDHILVDVANVQKKKTGGNGDWLFILIVTASSFVLFVALIFVVLVFRHKRKNGVWFKGLFMFNKEAQLPKIEIYRHSLGPDSPDILHMEDFKNTKVVDLHLHRGHFVAKKISRKKKTVTFKDRC